MKKIQIDGKSLDKKTWLMDIYSRIVRLIWNDKNFASASDLQASDAQNGVWTCLLSKTGTVCSEFISSECNSKCNSTCIPSERKNVEQCKMGTCFNPVEGTCTLQAPKELCESGQNVWYDDPYGNVPQCRVGCCAIGGQSFLQTETQCARQANLLGVERTFRTDVRDELSCHYLTQNNIEGACVYGTDENGKSECKFTTQSECSSIKGDFRQNVLCSNPALNTSCEKQKTTACIQGKDEVYWLDSCGNKENIYSASRVTSWNNGFVLSKQNSCSLGGNSNFLQNAKTCGNCNFFLGSICRKAKTGEASIGDFVCGDLSCIDENGAKRMNGESWCSYQGSVGLDGNRATDTVGSRHYRNTCLRGEIVEEPCADYRNEICVESKTPISNGKTFSTSACTINRWQECFYYNSKPELKSLCPLNSNCFVKKVDVASNFKFDLCVPRYPPGFLNEEKGRGEGGEMLCNFASQKCTKVLVKKWGGWKCVANCECDTDKFAEQMNDLCISLGDCGTKANYLGTVTDNFKVTVNKNPVPAGGSPGLKNSYLGALIRYANEKEFLDKEAAPPTPEQLQSQLGIPGWLGFAQEPNDPTAKTVSSISLPMGAVGLLPLIVSLSGQTGLGVIGSAIPGSVLSLQGPTVSGAPLGSVMGPALAGFMGALSGASAGFTLVTMLLSFTGVGRGLPPELTYALMVAGTVAGAIIGIAAASSSAGMGISGALATLGFGSAAGSISPALMIAAAIAWVAIAVVVVFIIISFALGIGKVKKIEVESKCMPWQAKVGGSECSKCGSDGKTCTAYACSSLGQTCELINEMTDNPECVEINRDDVIPPLISPLAFNISIGYNYTNASDFGFRIKSQSDCLEPGTQIIFGINLSEPGRCKVDVKHTNSFDEMSGGDFGVSSLFRREHVRLMNVPTLEEMGYSPYNQGDRAEYNMYLRCQDKKGNTNTAEYTINFCVQKNIDLTAPIVLSKWPAVDNAAYLQQSQNVSVFTNEPADCRWDSNDKSYEQMSNQMLCDNDVDDETINGWSCRAEFPTLGMSNSYFVRCRDQPWLSDRSVNVWYLRESIYSLDKKEEIDSLLKQKKVFVNADGTKLSFQEDIDENAASELAQTYGYLINRSEILNETFITDIRRNNENLLQERNTMQNSYNFTLSKTINPLNIDRIEPDGQNLTFGTAPATVKMKVYVSGGYDGKAVCYYKFGEQYIRFFDTMSMISQQDFRSIYSGMTKLTVKCEDIIGNTAEKDVSFNVQIDADYPRAARIYSQGSTSYLITNENAQCVYSLAGCNYEFTNGTAMTGNGQEHTFSMDRGKEYFIKCKDEFNNNPGSLCSAIARRD